MFSVQREGEKTWRVYRNITEQKAAIYESEDDAKAAAQADYERRILSALTTTGPGVAEAALKASARDKIARIVTLDHLQLLQDFDVDGDLYRHDPECGASAYVTADAIISALTTSHVTPSDPVRDVAGELLEALKWYRDRAAGCRLIHSEGDGDRQALHADGGQRARAAIARAEEAGQ